MSITGLMVALLLLAAHVPFLFSYFRLMWEHDHYGFFPFAIAALAWLFVQRRQGDRFEWSWMCTLLVVLDVALVGIGIALPSPWPVMAGLNCSIFALLAASTDLKTGRSLLYLGVLPLTLLRIPLGMDSRVISEMQRLTTIAASEVLHKLKYIHFRAGNVIEFSDKSLMVEEACSGIQSLFTVIFLAAFIVAWNRRTLFHSVTLLVLAVFWAACCNIVRVVGIGFAWRQWDLDLTLEPQHSLWGYAVVAGAMLLLFSSDLMLDFVLSFVPDPLEDSDVYQNPFCAVWNRFFQQRPPLPADVVANLPANNHPAPMFIRNPAFVAIFAAVALWGQVRPGLAGIRQLGPTAKSRPDILMEDDLPDDLNNWKKADYTLEMRRAGNSFGQYSNRWQFQRGNSACTVSCDHAFRGWHNLESCYVARGWEIQQRDVVQTADDDWPAVSVKLTKPTGELALLIYSLFDGDGNGAVPPQASTEAALMNRLFRKGRLGLDVVDPILYQSQIFLLMQSEPDEELQKQLLDEHNQVRQLMREKYLERHHG